MGGRDYTRKKGRVIDLSKVMMRKVADPRLIHLAEMMVDTARDYYRDHPDAEWRWKCAAEAPGGVLIEIDIPWDEALRNHYYDMAKFALKKDGAECYAVGAEVWIDAKGSLDRQEGFIVAAANSMGNRLFYRYFIERDAEGLVTGLTDPGDNPNIKDCEGDLFRLLL